MDAGGDWLSGSERITGIVLTLEVDLLRPEPTLEGNKSEKRTRKELPWPVNPGDQSNRPSTLAIEGLKRKKKGSADDH